MVLALSGAEKRVVVASCGAEKKVVVASSGAENMVVASSGAEKVVVASGGAEESPSVFCIWRFEDKQGTSKGATGKLGGKTIDS